MVSPFQLPTALLGDLARAATAAARDVRAATLAVGRTGEELRLLRLQGEAATAQLERLEALGERILEQAADIERDAASVAEQTGPLIDVGNAMLERADRVDAAADKVLDRFDETLERADRMIAVAERIESQTGPIIDAADRAREQLVRAQRTIDAANEHAERALRLAEPLERAQARADRLFGRGADDEPL